MSSQTHHEGSPFNEIFREDFNQFIIHGLVQNVIGRLSIERLIKLDDDSSLYLFDDYVREALIDCEPSELPPSTGLRTNTDFIEGEEFLLKTPYFRSLEKTIVNRVMDSEVELIFSDQTKVLTPFDYPGLVSRTDFDFYIKNRPGRGSAYSVVGYNLELSRMISVLGITEYDTAEIIKKMKRIFEVSTKEYRHRRF